VRRIMLLVLFGIAMLHSGHAFLSNASCFYVNLLVLKAQRVKEAMTRIYQKLQVNICQRI
jgi:hypothetical protein